jgi:hypothetical protein
LKIIELNDVIRSKIKDELEEKMIFAEVDEVLEMKPVFRLESEIYYNDNEERNNPKLKIGKKKIDWVTLGKEVMIHEGFIIEINIYDPCVYELNKKYKGKRKIKN